jgi:hypothetical protein
MKILIEMTEQEYDEYREYLNEKEEIVEIFDTDVAKLKEEEKVEALKKVIKHSQYLDQLMSSSKKMDDVVDGSFRRADHTEEGIKKFFENRKERRRRNIQTALESGKAVGLKEEFGIVIGE